MKTHAVQLSICYNVLGHMQYSLSILGLAGEFCLIQPAISYSLVLFFTSTKANFVKFFDHCMPSIRGMPNPMEALKEGESVTENLPATATKICSEL